MIKQGVYWDQHLQKGKVVSRTGQREELDCDAVSTSDSTDPTENQVLGPLQ